MYVILYYIILYYIILYYIILHYVLLYITFYSVEAGTHSGEGRLWLAPPPTRARGAMEDPLRLKQFKPYIIFTNIYIYIYMYTYHI